MIYCSYQDSNQYIRSNIPLGLKEFPWASPSGTPSGEGVYLTVYPMSCPNTDTVQFISMQYSKMECSAVWCNAVHCGAVQCNAVQSKAKQSKAKKVQCSAVQCSAVQCSAVQCSAVQCSAVQCSAVQCSAVQCSAVQPYLRCSHRQPRNFLTNPQVETKRGHQALQRRLLHCSVVHCKTLTVQYSNVYQVVQCSVIYIGKCITEFSAECSTEYSAECSTMSSGVLQCSAVLVKGGKEISSSPWCVCGSI